MKRIIFWLCCIMLIVVGCKPMKDLNNSPVKRTEEFFNKYQTLDEEVIDDLYNVLANETTFNSEQRERYEKIMRKHYKNIVYDIKEDRVDGNNAIVTVEITVTDYSKILNDASLKLNTRDENFYENGGFSAQKYIDYILDKMEKADEKVKYTLDITLTKRDEMWTVDALTETNEKKIHGAYMY